MLYVFEFFKRLLARTHPKLLLFICKYVGCTLQKHTLSDIWRIIKVFVYSQNANTNKAFLQLPKKTKNEAVAKNLVFLSVN